MQEVRDVVLLVCVQGGSGLSRVQSGARTTKVRAKCTYWIYRVIHEVLVCIQGGEEKVLTRPLMSSQIKR